MIPTDILALPLFEDHHRAFAARIADWAARNVEANVDHHDVDGSCRALVAALGRSGLLDAVVPADAGGLHPRLDVRTLAIARATLAWHDGLADFAFAMQGLGTGPISLFGTPEQKARWLPPVRRGEAIAAFALSEPEAGSDVAALSTRAAPHGMGWSISGTKTWISNGGIADHYVVFARTGEAPGAKGLSAFLVPATMRGLTIAERIEVVAPHPLATLVFENCNVPPDALIGAPGDGFKIAMATLDVFRTTVGAAALGFAVRALDEALERARTRRLFGAPLGDLQLTQAALADSAAEVDAAALLIARAAFAKDSGKPRITREAALAKMVATENAQRVVDRAVQVFGGAGVAVGSKVEALYREVRALRIYEGATEVQKIVIARALLAEPGRAATRPGEGEPSMQTHARAATAHLDTFAAERLPPPAERPVFLFGRPELAYPPRLNCVSAFVDRHVAEGRGDALAILAPDGTRWTYADLKAEVDRIANVLTHDLGLVPGNRVLLRAPNTPMMAAACLAVLKAGGIVVATMPLLRARELGVIVEKAQIALALCDVRLLDELEKAHAQGGPLTRIVGFGRADAELERLAASAPAMFTAVDTAAEDICLFGFTSGTTGVPKCTMHNHRDMLAVCDGYSGNILRPGPEDRFIGSPPLAFTFGLGGLVLFPLRAGASTVLVEKASPPDLAAAIATFRPSVCFTAPTAYRAMIPLLKEHDLTSLRKCVSAGEALPKATFAAWKEATGLELLDGIGATEMLHIFIAAPPGRIRPGATGLPVPGYEAKVIGTNGEDVPPGTPGRLAVRGPTGCRYLDDERQRVYVQDGWNVTGDTYVVDADGYFWYQARSDDMIVSSGYNIAGPEVEAALLAHPAVAECGVVGAPDDERGTVVRAYVVLKPGEAPSEATTQALQAHVKAEIAPYKYPRQIVFVDRLPRTETGKLQRFALRKMAEADVSARDAAE